MLTIPLKHGKACVFDCWPNSCNHRVRQRISCLLNPICQYTLYCAGFYSEVSSHTVHQFCEIQNTKGVFAVGLCYEDSLLTDGASITSMSLITQAPTGQILLQFDYPDYNII